MSTAVESAVTELRGMIVNGELPISERITESSAGNLLGISRTPARSALSQLESEGLLIKLEGRGYKIRPFSFADLEKATEVRSVLEGIAAGRLASMGPSEEATVAIEKSIAMTEAIISRDAVTKREIAVYQEANEIYHSAIVDTCGNDFVGQSLERIANIPIIAPGAFTEVEGMAQAEMLRMTVGHSQHVIIWDAIRSRDPVRAESMMREHAGAPIRYAKLFIGDGYQRKLMTTGIVNREDVPKT
ncbi:GntR family transcriptional regulator [Amylibacter ulvae]|uniref:GntR family transcriptional regulator n=1 Tax=Paramylibacter ulvae TaxID=1651968 RepID=A0ABQ3D6L8_9RHOB|nr:GntR family transcriptional regulator [Amylibacter ulvae]GHA61592.1 GntR family transcriptional regulator [Amylibacter ulvae]